jgi:general secretion pathway protein B
MSFILDALRKSELERQRQSGPSIAELPMARDDRRLPAALVAIGVLLAVNVAVLMFFMLRDDAAPVAAPSTAPVASTPAAAAPAARPPVDAAIPRPEDTLAAQAMPSGPMSGPPASDAPEAPDPTLLPEAPYVPPQGGGVGYEAPPAPSVDTLPPQATAGLAELSVDLHIYSADPAKRAVFINGRRYTEGMALAEGPMVEEINRDGVVINHRGQRFLLPRN